MKSDGACSQAHTTSTLSQCMRRVGRGFGMPFGDVTIPLLDGEKGGWKLRETFATSVGAAIVAILAIFAVLVEYPEPAAVSDDHVAKYYLYYFQVTAV